MTDVIEADPDQMLDLVAALQSAVTAMGDELDQLDGELSDLMDEWSGDAADAYLSAQQGWNGSMAELRGWLSRCATTLAVSATRYSDTEAAVIERCS
jgi:early secretory antigenic target protein ESAT-6